MCTLLDEDEINSKYIYVYLYTHTHTKRKICHVMPTCKAIHFPNIFCKNIIDSEQSFKLLNGDENENWISNSTSLSLLQYLP